MAELRHNKTSKAKSKSNKNIKMSCIGRQPAPTRPSTSMADIEEMEAEIDAYNEHTATMDIFERLDNDAENPMDLHHPLQTENLVFCNLARDFKNKGKHLP